METSESWFEFPQLFSRPAAECTSSVLFAAEAACKRWKTAIDSIAGDMSATHAMSLILQAFRTRSDVSRACCRVPLEVQLLFNPIEQGVADASSVSKPKHAALVKPAGTGEVVVHDYREGLFRAVTDGYNVENNAMNAVRLVIVVGAMEMLTAISIESALSSHITELEDICRIYRKRAAVVMQLSLSLLQIFSETKVFFHLPEITRELLKYMETCGAFDNMAHVLIKIVDARVQSFLTRLTPSTIAFSSRDALQLAYDTFEDETICGYFDSHASSVRDALGILLAAGPTRPPELQVVEREVPDSTAVPAFATLPVASFDEYEHKLPVGIGVCNLSAPSPEAAPPMARSSAGDHLFPSTPAAALVGSKRERTPASTNTVAIQKAKRQRGAWEHSSQSSQSDDDGPEFVSGPIIRATDNPAAFRVVRQKLQHLSGAGLRELLELNMLKKGGAKSELLERCADAVINGCVSRCPKCEQGFLRYECVKRSGNSTWLYMCPGGFDEGLKMKSHCDFSAELVSRKAWRWS
jgi:hypothetical protein